MTIGTGDKKKVVFLVVLGAGALYSVYTNFIAGPGGSSDTPRSASSRPATDTPAGPLMQSSAPKKAAAPSTQRRGDGEWHPVYIPKRPEDRVDPISIDPTLHLDLLAKVQSVEIAGGGRNLFAFTTPPKPKVDLPNKEEPKIALAKPFVGPQKPPEPAKPVEPPPPPKVPITLKYYGFAAARDGSTRTAFFMDGEDILSGREGDTLKKRYRIVRLSGKEAVLLDTDSKQQETVPIAPEAQQG